MRPGELVAKTIAMDALSDEIASMGSFAQEGVTVMVPLQLRASEARELARSRAAWSAVNMHNSALAAGVIAAVGEAVREGPRPDEAHAL